MRLLLLLSALVCALPGCGLGDCSFEVSESETVGGLLLADGSTVGDTLTVAVVQSDEFAIEALDYGVRPPSGVTPDRVVEVLYDARTTVGSGDRTPPPFATAVRGDTVFVYLAGTLDAGLFRQTCSPPFYGITLDVREILVPSGTVATRVTTLWPEEISASTAASLRAESAERAARRPITT